MVPRGDRGGKSVLLTAIAMLAVALTIDFSTFC